MKLIEHLSKLDNYSLYESNRMYDKVFYPGGFLSIQLSEMHYCIPRKTLANINEYTHVEIMYTGPSSLLSNDFYEYSENRVTEEDYFIVNEVFGFIPVELVEDLLDKLNENYELVYGCEQFKEHKKSMEEPKERYKKLDIDSNGNLKALKSFNDVLDEALKLFENKNSKIKINFVESNIDDFFEKLKQINNKKGDVK